MKMKEVLILFLAVAAAISSTNATSYFNAGPGGKCGVAVPKTVGSILCAATGDIMVEPRKQDMADLRCFVTEEGRCVWMGITGVRGRYYYDSDSTAAHSIPWATGFPKMFVNGPTCAFYCSGKDGIEEGPCDPKPTDNGGRSIETMCKRESKEEEDKAKVKKEEKKDSWWWWW